MSFDDVWMTFLSAVGFGAGVYWFFKGFPIYREYRLLSDTPEAPICSIPMGLVHIHGKAWSEQVVTSPVTRSPCVFYKVDIEEWQQGRKGGGSWRHYMTDCNGVAFYLQDRTGKARIDAHGAELDLPRSIRCQTGNVAVMGDLVNLFRNWKSLNAPGTIPAPDEDLRSYVGTLGPAIGGNYRLTEYCLLAGHWYDVTGTCVENPNAKDEHDRNMIVKGQNEPTYLISFRSEQSLESSLRNRAIKYTFGGAVLSVVCLGFLLKKFGWL